MNECFYCENGEKLNSLMIPVCEMEYANIYLNRDQKHRGRLVVVLKGHKTEYFQLTREENQGYFRELAIGAKAVSRLYHPDKINYATYGDGVPHVHVHVVPKYKDGLNWGEPFDDSLPKVFLTEEAYSAMVLEIQKEIGRLAAEEGADL